MADAGDHTAISTNQQKGSLPLRSTLGLAAAITAGATYPVAIAAGVTLGDTASNAAVHFVVGTAFVILAAAMPDFGLARWVTWLGMAAAAVFGGTFILQGIVDLTHIEALDRLAFQVLGHELERVLPDVVYLWFAALLLTASSGRTRYIGWVVVPVVFGLELAILVGVLIGIDVPFIKATIFLPFIWLLFESVKPAGPKRAESTFRRRELAEGHA
jgi:hypothetical protein